MARRHSSAAYAPDDIEDAKRGHPELSLQPWAAARGLEYMGSTLPGAFSPVLPDFKEHVFNLSRGTLAPGRYGYVANELDQVSLGGQGRPNQPGGYVALRVNQKIGGLRSFLPFSGLFDDENRDDPFGPDAIWLPTTSVGVRTAGLATLPVIRIKSADRYPMGGNPRLDDEGLPGFRMAGSQWVDDQLRAAVAWAASPLASLGAPFARLRIDRGVLGVTRNGFVVDDVGLDALVVVTLAIVERLSQVMGTLSSPVPFASPLPAPDPASWPPGYDRPEPHEVDVLQRVAAELAMVPEDPVAFHRAHPTCPVPGRALGVVRGVVPGSGLDGRVGFFVTGGLTAGSYRSAVMVPALPGASTPLGGVLDPTSDLYLEVADGAAFAWPRLRSRGALNAAATVAAAVEAFGRLGLAGGGR